MSRCVTRSSGRASCLIASLILFLLLASSCRRDQALVDFSQQVRNPDDQGVIVGIDFDRLELEGGVRYDIRTDVQSFSSYNGSVTPLLSWKQRYVHLGLDRDKKVLWIAGIGIVVDSEGRSVVLYSGGVLKELDRSGRMVFEDGTVLKLAEGVSAPERDSTVMAKIDPSTHEVIEVEAQ